MSAPVSGIGPFAGLDDEQLAQVRVVTRGKVLAWPEANVDFAVAGLVERLVGIKSQRAHLSAIGSVTSEAKAASSRANDAKGGRPRTKAAPE